MPVHYDPEIPAADIRSITCLFDKTQGVSSKIVSIRYESVDQYLVTTSRCFYRVTRNPEGSWQIEFAGHWMS